MILKSLKMLASKKVSSNPILDQEPQMYGSIMGFAADTAIIATIMLFLLANM